jgi:hypothetical protein
MKHDEHFKGDIVLEYQEDQEKNYTSVQLTVYAKPVNWRWFIDVRGTGWTQESLLEEIKKPQYINQGGSETFK